MIEYAVRDFMHPAKLEDIHLKGAIEAQMEIFRKGNFSFL